MSGNKKFSISSKDLIYLQRTVITLKKIVISDNINVTETIPKFYY